MIEKEIHAQLKNEVKTKKEKGIIVAYVLENTTHKELLDFIVANAKHNPDFTNTVLLKFASKIKTDGVNKYNTIIRTALKKFHFDFDDVYGYDDDAFEIDVLDEWFSKAREYLAAKNYEEAIAIAKACIEEYAICLEDVESEIVGLIGSYYEEEPFDILSDAASVSDKISNELYAYCKQEMQNKKYQIYTFADSFNNLLSNLATIENTDEFITSQDNLLKTISDKSSYEAKLILERKIDFYKKIGNEELAQKTIVENIQIESFREIIVKQKIANKDYEDAKKLIEDFLDKREKTSLNYNRNWHELLLEIAHKQNDITTIRKLTLSFIESNYNEKYYRMYKSTFRNYDWLDEMENIIKLYANKHKYFNESVATILVEEKEAERLLKYIAKHPSLQNVEKYYTHFSDEFTKETLVLLMDATNNYVTNNLGREHYEYVAKIIKKIQKLEGGNEVAMSMINRYKVDYKNRRVLIEILNKIKM